MSSDFETDAAAARRLFASFDSMEGLGDARAPAPPSLLARVRMAYPGVLAAGVIALAAAWLAQHYATPVMLFALLIGMAFHFLHEDGRCVRGVEFASKAILRIGVALLGVRITFSDMQSLGLAPVLLIVIAVATTIPLGVALARLLGLRATFGALTGGAVGICGASAALAIASALPKTPHGERDTILTVVSVTALSTVAMILYPMIAAALHFDDRQAGLFLGGTIHDVAQVVGAGYTVSTQAGDTATVVKLLRVTLLAPVVFLIALVAHRAVRAAGTGAAAPIAPLFLVAFLALAGANSMGWLPQPAVDVAAETSRWCLITAIAALGMKTSFRDLAQVGWRPIALIVAETMWIGGFVLGALILLG